MKDAMMNHEEDEDSEEEKKWNRFVVTSFSTS